MRRPAGGGTLLLHTLAVGLLFAALAKGAVASANPYWIESRCEFLSDVYGGDRSAASENRICTAQLTKESCEKYVFCWWRNTAAQNSLSDFTEAEYATPQAFTIHASPDLRILLYKSDSGANVVAIIGSTDMLLVGAGGSPTDANRAKIAFQKAYPPFMGKWLNGIVVPSIDPTVYWGVSYWRNLFGATVPMILSADFEAARTRALLGAEETRERDVYVYGHTLEWGSDSFLGIGSGKQYVPQAPGVALPGIQDMYLTHAVDLSVNGVVVRVTPTFPEIGGLSIFVPTPQVLIANDLFGPYFPDIAPLNRPALSVGDVMAELDAYRSAGAATLVFMHGWYVTGAQDVESVLTVERDALRYVDTETRRYIGLHLPLEDIVTKVQLPANLAASPFAQQRVGKVEHAVRAVYREYLGWFDGRPASLAPLPTAEYARRLVEMAGGESNVLGYAERCMTEHTTTGVKMALHVLTPLRQVYPSPRANALYVQALEMLGWSESSARVRNYYLSEAALVIDPMFFYHPQPGDIWTIGSTVWADFVSNIPGGTVDLRLSRDDGKTWTTLSYGVVNTGGHITQSWLVTGPATAKAMLMIVSSSDPNLYATTGPFTIAE